MVVIKPARFLGMLCLTFLLAGIGAVPARADGFVPISPGNLIKTFIRFGAMNIRDDNVIDDYIQTNECKIFKYFQNKDFRWHDVQEATRKAIRQDVDVYPTAYNYDSGMLLDRYDFENKLFRFSSKNGGQAINSFRVRLADYDLCDRSRLTTLPTDLSFVLDRSIQFLGIPLGEEQAKELLKDMEKNKNTDRKVYARFKIVVSYIQPMIKHSLDSWGHDSYVQGTDASSVRIDSRLDSIEFYQDEARTKLIIKYVP